MGGGQWLGPAVASPMTALQKWDKMGDLQNSLAFLAVSLAVVLLVDYRGEFCTLTPVRTSVHPWALQG